MKKKILMTTFYLMLAIHALSQVEKPTGYQLTTLSLDQALATALENNPQLRASEAGWRASLGGAQQARYFLNPSVEYGKEDFGGDSPLQLVTPQQTLAISQTFRIAGQRSAQKNAAHWTGETARFDYQRQKLDLISEVERSFAELLGAQERGRISADNLETAKEVFSAVSAMVETGEVSPIELSRAENEKEIAELDYQSAARGVEIARRALARVMGQNEPNFGRAEGQLYQELTIPDQEAITAGLKSLPDLRRWDTDVLRLKSSLSLAKRSRIPDLTLTVGRREYVDTRERAYMAGISIAIPLFNRNNGAVIEASALLDQGELERRAEEIRLQNDVELTLSALENAAAEVKTLKVRVLPNAQKVFDALNEGYQLGKFSLLDLLEARRSLARVQLRYVDSLVNLNTALSNLKRLRAETPAETEGAKL